jgi:hypothetical protein
MKDLGYDPDDTARHRGRPDRLRQPRRAHRHREGRDDGANEANDYADHRLRAAEPRARLRQPGRPLKEPERWQPINLSVAATQNGIILPAGVQTYIGAQWGSVTPFAMKRKSSAVPWHDPGPRRASAPR